MTKYLQDKVAIVTGAGGGLGRAHALALAAHGARVVVNDLGTDASSAVVADIVRRGGTAIADGGDVTDPAAMQAMVAAAVAQWGRVDILVNNAGILRDKSFAKMTLEDFQRVMNVHVTGAFNACKAVWDVMRGQHFGRIVMTTSSSGLYGNFGQANYGAAKLALVGLMQTLAIEGERYGIRVNCLAPTASTGMTAGVLPEEALRALGPEKVSPGLVALVGDDAPTRMILLAGGGSFESAHITMTRGLYLDPDHGDVALQLAERMDEVQDRSGEVVPAAGWEQYKLELAKAGLLEAEEFSA